ncbi:hypothetical protein STEG23_013156 [Scotinomys teguina]
MASGSGTKNLDFRRKWDKDEYEKLAEKRLTEEREKKDGKLVQPVKRELLAQRLQGGLGIQAWKDNRHYQDNPTV